MFCPMLWRSMGSMGSMGSMALLWVLSNTNSMGLGTGFADEGPLRHALPIAADIWLKWVV